MSTIAIAGLILVTVGAVVGTKKKYNVAGKIILTLGVLTIIGSNIVPMFLRLDKDSPPLLYGMLAIGCLIFGVAIYKFLRGMFKNNDDESSSDNETTA